MNKEIIKKIEEIIGYTFGNKELLVQAFTRKAFSNENKGTEHNELPEHFGDTVLELAVKRALWMKYAHIDKYGRLISDLSEGQFSEMEDTYVKNKCLAERAHKLGIVPFIRFGKGEKKQNCMEQDSASSNLFEAIVFAVWLDCGENIETVMQVVLRMLGLSDPNDI